jgi:predicted nucleotidyltransferase
MIDIEQFRPDIENVCRNLPVRKLSLFGSAITQAFSQSSDVDVLVVFDSDEDIDFFSKYFELKEQLERIFRREIDLVVDKPFKNPFFRESVEKTRTMIYEK